MTLDEIIKQFNGVSLDFDGVCGAQCVDVAKVWNEWGLGFPRVIGNAIDWIDRGGSRYDRIINTTDPNLFPKLGDIIVWGKMPGNDLGHVAVCISANSTSFTSFDQNWPPGSPCHRQSHNYNYVIGWLHPKTMEGGEMVIPDADNWFGRFNKLMVQIRGRELPREEFVRNFVGNESFRMVEILSDDAEADAALNAQRVGQVAVRDNWEGQIKALTDEVTVLKVKNSNQEMQLNNLSSELGTLRLQVKNQDEEIVTYQRDNDNLTKKVAELEKKVKELSSHQGDGAVVPSQGLTAIHKFLDWLRRVVNK